MEARPMDKTTFLILPFIILILTLVRFFFN